MMMFSRRLLASLEPCIVPNPRVQPRLRNNPGVPRSFSPNLPEFVGLPKKHFPYGLKFEGEMAVEDFGDLCRDKFDDELHLHGAMMIQNAPMKTAQDFVTFMDALGWRTQDYLHYIRAMGARSMSSTQISSAVRTASDEPPEWCIEPHCEYHTAGLPKKIVLFCQKPSVSRGESIISDNRQIYKELDPEVREKFEKLGIEYEVFYEHRKDSHYNSWQQNIHDDKEQVEEYLSSLNYSFNWEGDALRYKKVFPATSSHIITQEVAWFNQLCAHHFSFYETHPKFLDKAAIGEQFNRWPVNTRYGDGSAIPDHVLEHVREVVWRNTVALDLQPGDVLICDNYLAKHGRMPFSEDDEDRKVFVSVVYE